MGEIPISTSFIMPPVHTSALQIYSTMGKRRRGKNQLSPVCWSFPAYNFYSTQATRLFANPQDYICECLKLCSSKQANLSSSKHIPEMKMARGI